MGNAVGLCNIVASVTQYEPEGRCKWECPGCITASPEECCDPSTSSSCKSPPSCSSSSSSSECGCPSSSSSECGQHDQHDHGHHKLPRWGRGHVFHGKELASYDNEYSKDKEWTCDRHDKSKNCSSSSSWTCKSHKGGKKCRSYNNWKSTDAERYECATRVIGRLFNTETAMAFFLEANASRTYTRIFPVCVPKNHNYDDTSLFKLVTHPRVEEWAAKKIKCRRGSVVKAGRLACKYELEPDANGKCHTKTGCCKGTIHTDPLAPIFPYYTFWADATLSGFGSFRNGIKGMWNNIFNNPGNGEDDSSSHCGSTSSSSSSSSGSSCHD